MRIIIIITIIVITYNFCLGQKDLTVSFNDDKSFKKFILADFKSPLSRQINEKEPFVHGLIVKVEINLKGHVSKVQIVRSSGIKVLDNYFETKFHNTSGKWTLSGVSEGVDKVNLLFPIIQRTPPNQRQLEKPEVHARISEEFSSLKLSDVDNCDSRTCIIMPIFKNSTGPIMR